MRGKRVLSSGDFADIIKNGRKQSGKTLVLYSKETTRKGVALGVAIAKKIVPRAVKRNYIRRVIRTCFREHYGTGEKGENIVVRLRKSFGSSGKKALSRQISGEISSLMRKHQ